MESSFSHRDARCSSLRAASKGFTVIEMLVVTAIITVIAGVIVNSQASFNKTITLANTAYDVALSIRAAETYGMGGRAIGSTPTGYGIHFAKVQGGVIDSYTLFADDMPGIVTGGSVCHPNSDASDLDAQPGDCVYKQTNPNADSAAYTVEYEVKNGIIIKDLCALSDSWSCVNSNGNGLTALDIVFSRPNPTALMSANGIFHLGMPSQVTQACIVLESPQGGTRLITVGSSGQINANADSCANSYTRS